MKQLLINLLTTIMVGITMLCVLAMVPFGLLMVWLDSINTDRKTQ